MEAEKKRASRVMEATENDYKTALIEAREVGEEIKIKVSSVKVYKDAYTNTRLHSRELKLLAFIVLLLSTKRCCLKEKKKLK